MAGALLANLTMSTDKNQLGIGSSGNVSPTANQQMPRVFCSVQVANPSASIVNVTAIDPYVYVASPDGGQQPVACSIGKPNLGPGQTISVPAVASGANGNLYFNFEIIPHAPQVGGQGSSTTGTSSASGTASLVNPQTQILTVGAWVAGSDGSYLQATTIAESVVMASPGTGGIVFGFNNGLIVSTAPAHFSSTPTTSGGYQ